MFDTSSKEYNEIKINFNSKYPDYLWGPSLFIPGLGHILMGETGTGMIFMLISAGLIYAYLSIDKINNSSGENFAILFTYLLAAIIGVALLAVHIANAVTAYHLNRSKIKEYKNQLKVLNSIIENTNVSNNGVLYRAFSF